MKIENNEQRSFGCLISKVGEMIDIFLLAIIITSLLIICTCFNFGKKRFINDSNNEESVSSISLF